MHVMILYPQSDTVSFDLDYYLNTHIPLVRTRLTPLGLTSIDLDEGLAGAAPGTPATYAIVGKLNFDSLDTLQNALGTHGAELIADIANFTNGQPVMQIGTTL